MREVVESQHLDEPSEGCVRLSSRSSHRLNCFCARRVVASILSMPWSARAASSASVDEGDLVPEVSQPVVDWGGGQA